MYVKLDGTWDYQLMFDETLKNIEKQISFYHNNYIINNTELNARRLLYCCVLYTQVKNGARISEARDGVKEYLETGRTELQIRIRKRKDQEKRLIIIPNEIQKYRDIMDISKHMLYKKAKVIGNWTKNNFGHNTHSLRYVFVTHMVLEKNFNPVLISKMTGHRNLNYILSYTSKKSANMELKKFVDENNK